MCCVPFFTTMFVTGLKKRRKKAAEGTAAFFPDGGITPPTKFT